MIKSKFIITDIQRGSVDDGPGIRTAVFFKGCPLNCVWCHNPECISFEPQILEYPEKCIGCGYCDEGCYSGAKVLCGKEMSTDEVMREIMLDFHYYKNGGGITFTGGEPMCNIDFLNDIIDKCKENDIHVAVETSLLIYDEKIFKKLDLIMADLKIWDNETHMKYTGVGNEIIKENFKRVDELNIPIIARTPIIPGINDDIENIKSTVAFLKQLKNLHKYELLPYHPLGITKLNALGVKDYNEFTSPSKILMEELNKYANI